MISTFIMIDEPTAKTLVETHLGRTGEAGWTYISNANGAPAYNLLGFQVDVVSGAVTQWL